MSIANGPGLGITITPAVDPAGPDGRRITETVFELPGEREAVVRATLGPVPVEEATAREARRVALLSNTDPRSLTEGLEREVADLQRRLEDFDGYDRNGEPKLRLTGRERERIVTRWNIRKQALEQAQRQAAEVRGFQETQRQQHAAREARIEAAARAKAEELIESERIEQRAKLLAAQARAKGAARD